MTTKMLIDAAHPEETRVVVLRGNRVEEFDFESANRRPLRGNIYLAKVTRVEPSLQAAFVDFGGNRHGFLAFAEIHPDYYQIPTADRMALLAEEAQAARDEDDDEERGRSRRNGSSRSKRGPRDESVSSDVIGETIDETGALADHHADHEGAAQDGAIEASHEDTASLDASSHDESVGEQSGNGELSVVSEAHEGEDVVEQLGNGSDAMEEVPTRSAHRSRKQYKIQEVIKRRQILLVQVVKEERGNKGAALTTYLSLAGRYSVLMPNTARGGGISRKITNAVDRKRLKSMASELEVPEGMGVILRTAGASRTKVEVKRDFEYLMRLWESVRGLTLESTAPALVYEEGSLIKRAIRDLYTKDIEDIQVAGDEGYREAKDFMRMLMPSHAKVVQPYKDATPLFSRFGVESQLDAMFSSIVTLKSGGYIVMNQTEALVAVDVNSGRSTREHNIEDTALKTNLEAAEEVARQLRLRDLAGLVVIDFIDMEENRNNKAVERKLNDCLKNDRARIQVGRISHFGLLEMSRQRIRTGVLESSTTPCPHCAGTGLLRSTPSLALHVLRALEETLLRSATHDITLRTRLETALYILNQKRESLRALEQRFGVVVTVTAEGTLAPGQHFIVERGEPAQPRMIALPVLDSDGLAAPQARDAGRPGPRVIHPEDIVMEEATEDEINEEEEESEAASANETSEESNKRRRRRRRRGGRNGDSREGQATAEGAPPVAAQDGDAAAGDEDDEDDSEDTTESADSNGESAASAEEKRRRRRRRGGRRNRRDREPREPVAQEAGVDQPAMIAQTDETSASPTVEIAISETAVEPVVEAEDIASKKPRRSRAKKSDDAPAEVASASEAPAKPARAPRSRKKVETADVTAETPASSKTAASSQAEPVLEVKSAPVPVEAPVVKAEPAPVAAPVYTPPPAPEPEVEDPNRPKRTGWWAKAKQALSGS